jgi:hypothetical protein
MYWSLLGVDACWSARQQLRNAPLQDPRHHWPRFQPPGSQHLLEVRRAFTVFQLMTILEENHHSFLIVEHDPLLYEDAVLPGIPRSIKLKLEL